MQRERFREIEQAPTGRSDSHTSLMPPHPSSGSPCGCGCGTNPSNRSDRQADIGFDDVEKAVGSRVEHTFPSDYRSALQALNRGRPIALENHNDLSSSFRRFAQKLAGVKSERPAPKPGGLLGRLTQRRA